MAHPGWVRIRCKSRVSCRCNSTSFQLNDRQNVALRVFEPRGLSTAADRTTVLGLEKVGTEQPDRMAQSLNGLTAWARASATA
jgi:hypothetical protein